MKVFHRPSLVLLALIWVPVAYLVSSAVGRLSLATFFTLLTGNLAVRVRSCLRVREERAASEARLRAALAKGPTYVAYGSGAPKWPAFLIYGAFVLAALALIFGEAIFGPLVLRGFNGFLTLMMYSMALPLACLAAHGVWMALAWRLRSRYPDKVLVFANADGIGTAEGWVLPYSGIRRIDPCSWRSRYGTDNWIEIGQQGSPATTKVHINMAMDPPDEILKQLRDRARAAGAELAPALANGRLPTSGTQLGYRMGYLSGE